MTTWKEFEKMSQEEKIKYLKEMTRAYEIMTEFVNGIMKKREIN